MTSISPRSCMCPASHQLMSEIIDGVIVLAFAAQLDVPCPLTVSFWLQWTIWRDKTAPRWARNPVVITCPKVWFSEAVFLPFLSFVSSQDTFQPDKFCYFIRVARGHLQWGENSGRTWARNTGSCRRTNLLRAGQNEGRAGRPLVSFRGVFFLFWQKFKTCNLRLTPPLEDKLCPSPTLKMFLW